MSRGNENNGWFPLVVTCILYFDRSVTRPTVPTIPMSLVPFISTVNESWNSELETPEAKTGAKTATEYSKSAVSVRCYVIFFPTHDSFWENNIRRDFQTIL